MRIVEIKANELGGHRNQTINGVTPTTFPVPSGWAVIRGNEELENFPFGNFEVENVDSVDYMNEGSWVAGVMPEPEPVPEAEPTTEEILNAMLGVSE